MKTIRRVPATGLMVVAGKSMTGTKFGVMYSGGPWAFLISVGTPGRYFGIGWGFKKPRCWLSGDYVFPRSARR